MRQSSYKITSVLLVITLLAGATVSILASTPEATAQEPGYKAGGEEEGAPVPLKIIYTSITA